MTEVRVAPGAKDFCRQHPDADIPPYLDMLNRHRFPEAQKLSHPLPDLYFVFELTSSVPQPKQR
jgi:hypothetical protein